MGNVFENKYVAFDEEGFRKRLEVERRKLENMAKAQAAIGEKEVAFITTGRVSGLHLALSFLDEYVVRPKERSGAVRS